MSTRSVINRRTQAQLQPAEPPQNRVVQSPRFEQQQQPPQQGQLPPQFQVQKTPQDTFNLVFSRLNALDKSIREMKESSSGTAAEVDESTLNSIVDEFNSRTEILAGEIADLKDMLLKLQSFTMEVNQKLFLQSQSVTVEEN